MIDQVEMMQVLEKLRGDAVVIPTMRATVGWMEVSDGVARDVPVSGAMGKGSSFALGLSLARPDTKVIVFDGDGGLTMNLGALVTIANKAPQNLYHFVMDNGVYATTGGQPVPGAGTTSYAEMAQAAGYAHTYEFDDLEEFATQAQHILDQTGPVLVCIKSVPNIRYSQERAGTRTAVGPRRTTSEVLRDLMAELGTG
jgi:phosphonopyruvate decarboxylase